MEFLIEFLLFCTIIYLLSRYYLNYWSRNGFPQEKGSFLVGNIGPLLTARQSVHQLFQKFYSNNKTQRFIGFYEFYRPSLLIIDPELIHDIMIRDFNHFHDHNPAFDVEYDPLIGNIFSMTGQKWRELRVSLSPTFTSGKMRKMFPFINECATTMTAFIGKNIQNKEYKCDIKDLISRYNINIIASVAFGIDNDCINQRDHSFYINSLKFFEPNARNLLRTFLFQFSPKGMKLLRIKFAPKSVETFFMKLITEIIDYREKNKFSRNDFMDLLIKLKNEGYIAPDKDDDDEEEKEIKSTNEKIQKLTFNEIAAQAFVFFLAAFETASSAATFCLFEIAKNTRIQQKVHDEIDKTFNTQGITYDSVKELKYLDCCILEALRKYSPVPLLSRYCTADYNIPKTDLIIPKGTTLQIPSFHIMRDEDVYENPLEFRPERFLDSSTGNPKVGGLVFTAFGDGPRHCIGMRMAKLNLALGLSQLLKKYRFDLVDKKLYNQEIELDPKQFPTQPNGKIWLNAIER